MTSYKFTDAQLKAEILKENKNWFIETQPLTERFKAQKGYSGDENIWSSIKKAWIRLQRQKCAYCECKYGNEEYASINYDVEHYRPKSEVKAWPSSADVKENPNLAYGFVTGGASMKGYYLLAYDISNYAVACKECNTIFKSSCFPIEGMRRVDAKARAALGSELPLLLENDPNPVASTVAKNKLIWLRSNDPPHSACLRDFEQLYKHEPNLAERIVLEASELLAKAAYRGTGFRDLA